MKFGKIKIFFFFFIVVLLISSTEYNFSLNADDKIRTVPLVNLEELSPTFEEDKTELEKIENNQVILNESNNAENLATSTKKNKIYVNLEALDKITAKTSSIRLAVGEKKFFGKLEIKALKCQQSQGDDITDTVAYLQVKDLSAKNNNQVFLFNGWTFASSPTLRSIDHPVYDLWITSCENI